MGDVSVVALKRFRFFSLSLLGLSREGRNVNVVGLK